MSTVIQLGLFILTIIAIIYLYRSAEAEESNLLLKLFGYSFLGAFMLDLNGLKLPLGFVIFLLFFRNIPINAIVKRRAAYIGLAVFIISLIFPFIETKLYEIPRKVELQDTNFFSGSLVEEWENISKELEITNGYGIKMREFQTVINADGEFKVLRMSLEEEAYPYLIFYHINLSKDGENVEVKRSRTESNHWGGSFHTEEEIPDIHSLLYNIDLITKPMLNGDGINYYTIRTQGHRTGYAILDQDKFSISKKGKEKIEDSQLPVDGILVQICGSSKIDQYGSMYTCEFNEHFLLGMMEREIELNESSVLTVARKISPEISQWLDEHTGDHIASEIDGEFVLKTDGVEEKVTEDQFVKALKETPIVDITFNDSQNIWHVKVENPYGNAPHIMEFELYGSTREVINLVFR